MERSPACCFSGYRPEKFNLSPAGLDALAHDLEAAVREAAADGYRIFVSGMSRGFDLWAAETVLKLRKELSIQLLCAVPFDGQSAGWEPAWQALYRRVLLEADFVQSLSREYTPDCYFVRNRFMVQGCSRLICWYDGRPGGTKFTVRCAKRSGLELVNLADRQLCLYGHLRHASTQTPGLAGRSAGSPMMR